MRRRRPRPVARFPSHLERKYAARLVKRQRMAAQLLREAMDANPRRRDDDATWFSAIVTSVRRVWEAVVPTRPETLMPTAQAVDTWATGQTARLVETVAAIDVTRDPRMSPARTADLLQQWARENVALIRTMDSDAFDDLARAVVDAVAEGRTDLDAVIRQRWGVAESRARLIARDQIAKLNGRITQHRQESLGVTSYEWSTSGDERVRPSHRALDGKVFAWSSPPSEGHPGQAIACRCVALPVFEDEPEDDG